MLTVDANSSGQRANLHGATPFAEERDGGRHPQPATPRTAMLPPARRVKLGSDAKGWGLLAPALAILLIMTVAPTIYLVYFAFRQENLLGSDSFFVGLRNFSQVLSDPDVWHGAAVTGQFVVLAVSLELAFGLLLALMLNTKLREISFLTTLFILPLGVAPVVSALVFRELLNPAYGWVDYYLQSWGLISEPIDWLSQPVTAWIALIAVDVWQWTPFVALILLAGLQNVPMEPREAAVVDGAGPLRVFWHVTLPLLRPFVAIALVLRAIEAFKTFASAYVLTGGGPGTSTELITLDIYRLALQDFNVGAASAIGICFLVVLALIMGQLLKVLGRNTDILED
jgi:multiple sugar transport system permease protein